MNKFANRPSVLLVSPQTYNYHELLCDSFELAGFDCFWLNERPYSSAFFKIVSRLLNLTSRRFSARFYFKRLRSLFASGFIPSYVLVIKGECIHPSVLDYIRGIFPRCKFLLYFWDSTINLPGYSSILPFFDAIASFDFSDCSTFGWKYLPLFAGNSTRDDIHGHPVFLDAQSQYDWSFVGVVHSDRLNVICRLLSTGLDASSRFFLYIYFPSLMHLVWYSLVSPLPLIRLWSYIHFRPLSPSRLPEIYNASLCVLDIHHPNQSGLTMRTIESILSGLKVVTTNSCVVNETFYSPERVHVIDRVKPCIPYSFLTATPSPLPKSVVETCQPVQWVKYLLSL